MHPQPTLSHLPFIQKSGLGAAQRVEVLGELLGLANGEVVGATVGFMEGEMLGEAIGLLVGDFVGSIEGEELWLADGYLVGEVTGLEVTGEAVSSPD